MTWRAPSAPSAPVGNVVHLAASHMYALLSQLERDGLITGECQEQGIRPPRRVYRITEAGCAVLSDWLDAPVSKPRDVLLEFPLKLYLAQRMDRERALALVRHQYAHFAGYLADLEREPLQAGSPADQTFLRLVREGRIERTRSTLTWLDRCADALDSPAPTAH